MKKPRHLRGRSLCGFSLIELITVMAVISILAGLTMPAVRGLTGTNGLNTGARKLADWLNLARSEAIARRTIVRFVVARDWKKRDNGEDVSLRKISLWAWNAEFERFLPLTKWEELPTGVVIEPERPAYLNNASYAQNDLAIVHGACVLGAEGRFKQSAEFDAGTGGETITGRFIEFLPTGGMRIPGGTERRAIFVATQGFTNPDGSVNYTERAGVAPAKWAQVNVETLTGRIHVYRP